MVVPYRGRLKTRDLTSRDHQNCGDWHRETGQRGTISQGWTSQDWTTRHQIKHIATGWTSVGPRKNWTCWTISERIKSCLSRFDSGAYSRLKFLRAVSHSVSAHTESLQLRVDNRSNSNSSDDEVENRHGASCASSANFRGVGTRNRQRQPQQQPRTTVAKCASWRHVLASHWCRADIEHVEGALKMRVWKMREW